MRERGSEGKKNTKKTHTHTKKKRKRKETTMHRKTNTVYSKWLLGTRKILRFSFFHLLGQFLIQTWGAWCALQRHENIEPVLQVAETSRKPQGRSTSLSLILQKLIEVYEMYFLLNSLRMIKLRKKKWEGRKTTTKHFFVC